MPLEKESTEILNDDRVVFDGFDLSMADSLVIGNITIHSSGEVDYPDDISKAAKDFWEAVIEAFPDVFNAKNRFRVDASGRWGTPNSTTVTGNIGGGRKIGEENNGATDI